MRALFLFVFLLPSSLFGGWSIVRTFNDPVTCGFFFDANNGFIGTGHYASYASPPHIWLTTDGGATWVQTNTPSLSQRNARISNIFMKSPLIGYASISEQSYGSGARGSLWKTTNGGLTWFDHSQGNKIEAVNVYATPFALVVTGWTSKAGTIEGGVSFDDGLAYQHPFFDGSERESNGIDFSDDMQGVVTPGPSRQASVTVNYVRPTYFTLDGGRTWQQGQNISESWSVYALKGTSTFLTLPEGYADDVERRVLRTTNTGQTWQTRFSFSGNESFTGHIDGVGQHVYVQSDIAHGRGLYRSDDLGATWKNVGGPSNWRDSRFIVTGCKGDVVYAFDTFGNLWKTTDGGDGTLKTGGQLFFGRDSLILTTICTDVEGWIPVTFSSCDDSVAIDAMFIENDPNGQFMLDTLGKFKMNGSGTMYVPIVYFPGAPGVRGARLRIVAHSSDISIDTTIELLGHTVKLPEPYVPDIERGEAGDTVEIPIYLDKTTDPFSITDYEVRLSFNTDLIDAINAKTLGTLSSDVWSIQVLPEPGGVKCRISLRSPITQAGDLQLPLLIIQARVFLTDDQTTTVVVDSFNVVSGSFKTSLLGCSERSSSFTINFMCGDSTLSAFMRTGKVSISGIHPNPNTTGDFTVEIGSAEEDVEVTIAMINSVGVEVRSFGPTRVGRGKSSVQVPADGLSSGLYYLRVSTPYGTATSQPVAVIR